jgi:hypothetical protein
MGNFFNACSDFPVASCIGDRALGAARADRCLGGERQDVVGGEVGDGTALGGQLRLVETFGLKTF